jgi:NADH:ubiquinone oxidoreductase subunit C
MLSEEKIKQELISKFAFLKGKISSPRPRRIFVEVELNNFLEVFEYTAKNLNFSHLCTITGLDESDRLGFIYHLSCEDGILFNLKTSVPKAHPVLKTVISLFPGAEIYERELVDLFGAEVEGLPKGERYPLTDDWPKDDFPLRKDWRPKNA